MYGIENRSKSSKGPDVYLILIYIALVVIGWLAIYSSSYDALAKERTFEFSQAYGKQLIWIIVSVVFAIAVLLIDNKIIQSYAYHTYLISTLLIISVLIFGTEISGAKAWIKLGPISLQPIEFAKFATALALAKFFSEGKTVSERKKIWLSAFGIIAVPAGIAILQHDTGSALVFCSFIILFYREGFSAPFILLTFLGITIFVLAICFNELYTIAFLLVLFIIACIFYQGNKKMLIRSAIVFASAIILVFAVNVAYTKVLEPHQRQRIDTIFGKSVDPKGADFNLNQSKIAIGSGGFFGKGYLKGTQTKLNFVPEQSTDFIFCSIGEEFGFLGSLVVIGLYMTLIIRIILSAEKSRGDFTRIYGYGVASIFFFHLIINIGMTIGLVPVIGIPLPFLSYGGSSLWGFTILLFLYIKLSSES